MGTHHKWREHIRFSLVLKEHLMIIKEFHKGLTAIAKCFDIEIQTLTRVWCDIYETRKKFRGKADAVKFCKELNTVAERYALHQRIEPIPWTRSSKDGLPLVLDRFKPYLRSKDSRKVIMALSVMRTIECLRLPISKDISSVIDPPKGIDYTLMEDIISFIPEWLKGLKPLVFPEMKYHLTVKNGPNGHALLSSDKDVRSVMNDSKLYGAIRTVEKHLADEHPMEDTEAQYQGVYHSKLTQFPEKSGKTRTIAVIDYYSQRCLKPLHEGITKLLSRMVSDGTFSHLNVGKFAKRKTEEKSYIFCADLTAATDRFPKQILEALLRGLVKETELASSLWTLLAERTFRVAWSGELVTYSCGQPMGCYSSWPLFALGHHLVVEYAAKLAGYRPRKAANLYRLIGDDVIITEELTSQYYQNIMTSLGLVINKGKTVESLPSQPHSCAEVAKQLYLNGTCLSPLTPGIVRDLRKPHMFNACFGILSDRYDFISSDLPPILINELYPKIQKRKLVCLLASNPINGVIKPGKPGYDLSNWKDLDLNLARDLYLDYRIEAIINASITMSADSIQTFNVIGDLWEGSTQTHPRAVTWVVTQLKQPLSEAFERIQFAFDSESKAKTLDEIAYIPDPSQPYRSRRELKLQRQSQIIVRINRDLVSWL